jgi:hypothetical protein
MRKQTAAIAFITVALLLLSACGGVNLKSVDVNALKSRVEQEFAPTKIRWERVPASQGGYRNSSIPQWARDSYEACVFWRDNFQSGSAWGWVLVSNDRSTYILELGYEGAYGHETMIVDRW